MKSVHSVGQLNVTPNLFQGPFNRSWAGVAARWMLKQIQYDATWRWGPTA